MASDHTITFPLTDRWSYLWLLLGGIMGLFSFGQWAIPLAPWLSIMFFIRFMHTQKPIRGYVILSLVGMVSLTVHFVWLRLIPPTFFPPHMLWGMIIVSALVGNLTYLADRLIAPRLKGLAAVFVFPVTFTAWEFILLTNNPMGDFGALGFTQYSNLPLMQVVSVTGLSGLTFLITWFGASVNWIWERSCSPTAVRRCGTLYGTVMALVLLYGGVRLVLHESPDGTMRIASFTQMDFRSEGAELWPLIRNDRAAFREKTRCFQDRYFAETRRQADAGAQLILWPELAGICASEDEVALIERGRQLAREKSIYLAMPMFTQHDQRPAENKLVVVDPAGEVVMEHYKYGGNQFEGSVLGDGVLRTFQTPSATVSGVICWDMDFPGTVSQSGRNGTDILLNPTADWRSVSKSHATMAVFRAIENGVSLVRQSDNGQSIVTDPYGRTLATMDHFTASERLMIAQVPTTGVTTVYSVIGNLFPWATLIVFPALVCWAVIQSRQTKRNRRNESREGDTHYRARQIDSPF
jgi:apolipoprotein N-acyltransferase